MQNHSDKEGNCRASRVDACRRRPDRAREDSSLESGIRSCKARACCLLAAALFLLFPALAHPGTFTTSVDRTEVALGEQVQLTLRFEDVPHASQPELPALDGFITTYDNVQTQANVDHGTRHDVIAHTFLLTPTREGMLLIPSLSLQIDKQTFSSRPITIKAVKDKIQGGSTEDFFQPGALFSNLVSGVQTVGMEDFFRLGFSIARTNLFLSEVTPLDLKLCIRTGIRYRGEKPLVAAPGFGEIKLPYPVESRELIDGKSFVVYTFRTLASPVQFGYLTLGPAQAELDVLVDSGRRFRLPTLSDPFFQSLLGNASKTKRIVVTSPYVPVRVAPLPDAGKPADFTGTVGHYALDVTANPTTLRVDEPVALTIRVVGQGNLATLTPPKFTPPKTFKSYEPVVKGRQTDEMGYTGEKVFEQTIMPLSTSVTEIPPVKFSFFDPELGRYQTLSRGPIQLTVRESAVAETTGTVSTIPAVAARRPQETPAASLVYLKPDLGAVVAASPLRYRQTWFLAGQGLPVLALVVSVFAQRRWQRLRNDIRYARLRRACANAQQHLVEVEQLLHAGQSQSAVFYAALFKTLQDYLGDRLNLSSPGITSDIIEEELRPRALPQEICQALREVFAACDTARFAPSRQDHPDRERLLKIARETVAAMEKMPF